MDIDTVYLAKYGDQESIEKIIKNKQFLIYAVVKENNFYLKNGDIDDLVQEGNLGLVKAIKYFNKEKNIKFNTFAGLCIKCQMIGFIEKQNSNKNIYLTTALSYNDMLNRGGNFIENISSNKYNPEEIFLKKEKFNSLKDIQEANLSKFEKEILQWLMKGYSYRNIIELLNEKPKRIDNTIQRIKQKIKKFL